MSDNAELELQINNLKEKRTLLQHAIHKTSNSLLMTTPGSHEESRLIQKMLAYRLDYQVYDDEIKELESKKTHTPNSDYLLPYYGSGTSASTIGSYTTYTTGDTSTTTVTYGGGGGGTAMAAPKTPVYSLSGNHGSVGTTLYKTTAKVPISQEILADAAGFHVHFPNWAEKAVELDQEIKDATDD